MKICIDVQTTKIKKTGLGFYTHNLIDNLKKIDKKNNYFYFAPQSSYDLSTIKRFSWDQFKFPKLAKKNKIDILHQPCFSVPILYRGKKVVTVHDLIGITYKNDLPFAPRQFFGKFMPFSYHYADRIIAISQNTKKDLIKLLNIPEEKITVIPNAVNENYKPVTDSKIIKKVKEKYKTGEEYILFIGCLNPRKNLIFLIDVFAQIAKKFPKINLVIAGNGWQKQNLLDQAKKLGLENRIIFTGYFDEADKMSLYSGAKIFAFPSLYEGFGLPPLEAFACGVPVVAANTSSIPEVVEGGGIILPLEKEQWVKNISDILSNDKLAKKLIDQGLIKAKQFSWEKCAKATLKVYEELYNENRH